MFINIKTKELIKNLRTKLLNIYDNNINIVNKVSNYIIAISLDINELELITREYILVDQIKLNKLEENIYKHINLNMPLQYIEGHITFLDLKIAVKAPILIPRIETEYWVYNLIQDLNILKNESLNILDLCTGSGCIALAFAKNFKNSIVYALDISEKACNLAMHNAKINDIKNIKILKSDLFDNLEKDIKFDLIVANPPYISHEQFRTLDPMVKNWEDKRALVANDSGLEIIKKIIYNSKNFLKINNFKLNNLPQLIIEIDYTHGQKVEKIMLNNKFSKIRLIKDLSDRDRIIYATL